MNISSSTGIIAPALFSVALTANAVNASMMQENKSDRPNIIFILTDDPLEINNLANTPKYQKVLLAMRNQLNSMIARYADPDSGIPAGLTIEFIKDPSRTRITTPNTAFGWIVPEQAVIQKGYQILVASTIENIEKNIGDIWDSKVIRENQSTNVEYKGNQLQENKTYYWKVRIFDKDNRISDYSEPQIFVAGTFDKSPISHNYFMIEAANLQQEAYFNYFEEGSSSFESSNDILNQVWDLCKYTMKATTFAGYYVDGDRERILYEADAYINQLSHYGVDNEYAIGRKTIEYFFDSRPTWPT